MAPQCSNRALVPDEEALAVDDIRKALGKKKRKKRGGKRATREKQPRSPPQL
jgi:hypothetical protein